MHQIHIIRILPTGLLFFRLMISSCSFTCDRTEFLGRNGTLKNPAAMFRSRLSGKKGVALDPCAAIQVSFELAAGQEREIIFRLGSGRDMEDANRTHTGVFADQVLHMPHWKQSGNTGTNTLGCRAESKHPILL